MTDYSFFEYMKSIFKEKKNIEFTYRNIEENNFPKEWLELNLDSAEFVHMEEHLKQEMIEYSDNLKNSYLNRGLSDEEVKLRQLDEKNILPQRKRIPLIVRFLKEFTTVFCIMLEIAALISLLSYALTPDDLSGV